MDICWIKKLTVLIIKKPLNTLCTLISALLISRLYSLKQLHAPPQYYLGAYLCFRSIKCRNTLIYYKNRSM